jgi:type I restriction enzyme S subunit
MSELNYLEKLLDGYEVEWKALKDVVSFRRGSFPQPYGNSDWYDGEGSMPFVQVVDVLDGGFALKEKTKQRISKLAQPKSVFVEEGTVIVTLQGTIGRVAITQYDCFVDRTLAIFTNYIKGINKKYFAYQLKNKFDIEKENARGSTLKTITKEEFSKFQIPIPCPENPKKSLEIQAEIVRILDTFTELTTELTTELNARKKQYNYYRDQLLSFEDGEVEWKPLGDVTKKWYSGGTPRAGNPEYYDDGDIPWLRTQEVKFSDIEKTEVKVTQAALDNSSAKWIPANCVIIAISGATAGRSAINKIPLTTNQHCGCLEIDSSKALYRYVFHWVSFNYENIKSLGQGARGDLNSSIIKNFKFPVPFANDPEKSLAEQARIVAILDKFDTLTTSLQEGLPREIELRQKQYEYYRDLLLSFPKPDLRVA